MSEVNKKELNKNGDLRGVDSATSFKKGDDAPSKAGKKANHKKQSVKNAVLQSNALVQGHHRVITPEVQQFVRDELTQTDKDGITWIQGFVKNFLQEAKEDPNSNAARQMANVIFKQDLLSTLDKDILSQEEKDKDFKIWQIRSTLYDKQQEVYDNDSDKTILIINSRRSGKTELMGRLIAKGLLLKDGHCVYINRNSAAAIRQIRSPLKTALDKIGLKCIKGSVEGQEMHFDNGSQLLILGNNNAADIDKLRGERISLCIMDECAHQRNVRTLVREVISPALKDYGDNAKMVMVGTPPRIPHTYVEEMWNNPYVKKYHWTFMDNPFIPNRDKVIEEVCQEFGVLPDAAFIKREYLGEIGVYDTEAQVFYGFNKEDVPDKFRATHCYVGVDWGFEDKAAVVGVVADSKNKKAYIVKDWSERKKSISEICEHVKEMKEYLDTFRPSVAPTQIICDTNEKSAVYELNQTYKLNNVTLAYKYDKDLAIEQLAEWLRAGTINTTSGAFNCANDFINTLWERDEETDKLLHVIDDDLYHPNAAMALLYVSRQFDYDTFNSGYSKSAKDIINEVLNI